MIVLLQPQCINCSWRCYSFRLTWSWVRLRMPCLRHQQAPRRQQFRTLSLKFLHDMMTSSNENIFRVTGPLLGNSPVVDSSHKGQWRRALVFSLIFKHGERVNKFARKVLEGFLHMYSLSLEMSSVYILYIYVYVALVPFMAHGLPTWMYHKGVETFSSRAPCEYVTQIMLTLCLQML